MRRFRRAFCCVVFSVLVGGLASPADGQVSRISFDEPHDGTTWHRGDVIRVRIFPSVAVPASGVNPVLELVIGENTRVIDGRIYQNGSQARFNYPVRSDDAAAADEVRLVKMSLAGGVEVDLSGFTPTTYAVDVAPAAFRRSSRLSALARSSCLPAAFTVPVTRYTGSSGFTRRSR